MAFSFSNVRDWLKTRRPLGEGSRMQLFCSTREENGPEAPLASAREFFRKPGFIIWSVQLPIPRFLDEIGRLLDNEALVSACILDRLPPEGKEWLFFEWRGRLLVDLDHVDRVFRDVGGWKQTQVHKELSVAIFEPATSFEDTDMPSDFEGRAARYLELLEGDRKGEILLKPEWIETEGAQRKLFGRYSDPEIGGAIALMSLSGAADPSAREFNLRTPASLDLYVDRSSESIVARPIRDSLEIRCIGYSTLEDFERMRGVKTPVDRWAKLHAEVSSSTPARYFVAIELDARVDPTIVIPRGAVFEHVTLVGVQTLAVAADSRTIVAVDEVKPMVLPAYCLNSELSPPHGQSMRPTPFVYRLASGTQGDVWRMRQGR